MKTSQLLLTAVAILLMASCQKKEETTPFLILETDSVVLSADGGSASVSLSCNTDWVVSGAGSSVNWLSVMPNSGTGNALITLDASANTEVKVRSCKLNVRSIDGTLQQQLTVEQEAAAGKLEISPTVITLESGAGNSSTFTIASNTKWSLNCDADWLSFDALEGLAGTTSVKVSTRTLNFSDKRRSAEAKIVSSDGETRTITINQEALFAQNCEVSIANDIIMYDGIAGDISFGPTAMGYIEKYYRKSVATTYTEREIYEDLLETGNRFDTSYDFFYSGKLDEGAEYVYCAVAYNKDSYTGPMLMYSFKTKAKTTTYDAALDVYRQSNKWYFSTEKRQRCHHYYLYIFTDSYADYLQSFWDSSFSHAFMAYLFVQPLIDSDPDDYIINDMYNYYLSDTSASSCLAMTWGVSDTGVFSSEICHDYGAVSSSPQTDNTVIKRPTREEINNILKNAIVIKVSE